MIMEGEERTMRSQQGEGTMQGADQENARRLKVWRRSAVAIVVVIGLLGGAPAPDARAQGNPNRLVFPRDSSPYGNTYGEWTAQWWQWLMSIPSATNPNLDTTGANCGVGQSGPVWFLAGTFGGTYTRSCTLPAGKALLITPLTQLDGNSVFDCEPSAPELCIINNLRALAAGSQDNPQALEVTIDGFAMRNLSAFRVQSPIFPVTYPAGAVFGIPKGTYTLSNSEGYWLLVAPLSPGKHTVHVRGVSSIATGGFVSDVMWSLTVNK
jgi:hypothetical protein